MTVREVLRIIENDGWIMVAQKGSHRQYKHPTKPGRVTVAGHPKDDLAPGTLNSIYGKPDSRIRSMQTKYLIVIEKTPNNLSAFSPDLPGCVATGVTQAEVEERMRDAIRMHLDGMREDGLPIPEPSSIAEYIEA